MNVVFVGHCDFSGNSAMHIFSIANGLRESGVDSVVLVPSDPGTVHDLGTPHFAVGLHKDVGREPIVFPDGRGPDLVHAWTPRESVRLVTERLARQYSVPYVVHMEDNEETILENELGGPSYTELRSLPLPIIDRLVPPYRSHPVYYPRFLAEAAGTTAVMDTLLEFNTTEVPATVFWPGFDPAFAEASPDRSLRKRLGAGDSDFMVVYNGTVHKTNLAEVTSLVLAVSALRRYGLQIVLVKTGVDHVDVPYFEEGRHEGAVIDLRYCSRAELPPLLASSDLLVQPGCAGPFNDYRFPSKLPEFLVSGRPVLLPRTNIGRFLKDDDNCVLLDKGHSLDIAEKIKDLIDDAERRTRIGTAGRSFALRELTWPGAVARIRQLYDQVLENEPTGVRSSENRPARSESLSRLANSEGAPVTSWCPKLVAFYLPQFHPIPENDRWWGDGFTEWTNVRKARPNFAGHYQPQVPTELGYYDLRDPAIMERQAELARAYGIQGFCYYYYWFNGTRLLEQPLDQMLGSGRPDLPFCICWANENWSRRWDGSEDKVLMEQEYRPGYAEQFMRDIVPILKDPRYIRVKDAPLLLVYRADLLPDAQAAVKSWRKVCLDAGIPKLHLAAMQTFGITDIRPFGFDAAVDFPPHTTHQALISPKKYRRTIADFRGFLADYQEAMRLEFEDPPAPYLRYRGVMPGWDNTPRRQNRAYVYVNSSTDHYQTWLERMVEQAMVRSPLQEPLVFLNAWNEWGEGAYLEPDSKNGCGRLQATRRALCRGVATYLARMGLGLTEHDVEDILVQEGLIAPGKTLDK